MVNVSASWPGASASDVAEAIAAPLETQLNGVDHMLYMESTSSDEGTYRLSITFAAGTDADLAAIDVQNRVAQALAQLPAEVQQNGVQVRKRASNLLMGVSLYSPLGTLTPLFVSNYASTQVREALARLPGVGEVQMFGARDYSMRIWLRPDRMNALNITTDDVAQALREQNVQGAAGQVGTPPVFNGQQQTLTINGLGRLNEAASFGEIIIRRGAQGQLVRLADVATIELGARSYSSGAQLNGKASAYLGIYPTPTANALQDHHRFENAQQDLDQIRCNPTHCCASCRFSRRPPARTGAMPGIPIGNPTCPAVKPSAISTGSVTVLPS